MKKIKTRDEITRIIDTLPVSHEFTLSSLHLPLNLNENTFRTVTSRLVNQGKLTRIRPGHYKKTDRFEQYLFVYGSMKKGFQNHVRLINAEYIGEFTTVGKYVMYADISNLFPYVLENEKRSPIHGELYKITNADEFKSIDDLEGMPTYYYRKQISVVSKENKQKISAWIYFRGLKNPTRLRRTNPLSVWKKELAPTVKKERLSAMFSVKRHPKNPPKELEEIFSYGDDGMIHLSQMKKGSCVPFKSFQNITFI
ncbi:gamma-glutamylcyclotransferase [Sulfuricurvum sp.]|uniref:gamma-glutamylcyclotransferase family protein n=1 Tax=Sulfuricurvum sp. TaxID=2025608 RepID=UPI002628A3A3|nr:gamma-glutamylcyclotransferase family protein [Sulfuricurvum sp.]MDD4950674.1 gamma-glutamylcyclotransferase [Sulfuricurvum sp.]